MRDSIKSIPPDDREVGTIRSQLSMLDGNLDTLRTDILRLLDRISPILVPVTPVACADARDRLDSEVAENVLTLRESVLSLQDIINDAYRRVDL